MKNIKFIITGGTIDSEWIPAKDTVIVKESSGIPAYIRKLINPEYKISFETVAMKDSREITDVVRNRILEVIESCPEECIVITHGTYTMAETGVYLKKHINKSSNKKIILTGSFLPLDGFSPNDASFNLGFALGAVQYAEPGIYVAMHSQLFNPENVTKDTDNAHFYAQRKL